MFSDPTEWQSINVPNQGSPDGGPTEPQPLTDTNHDPLLDDPVSFHPRRLDRIRRFPCHLQEFATHVQLAQPANPMSLPDDEIDTLTFHEANTNPQWQAAM